MAQSISPDVSSFGKTKKKGLEKYQIEEEKTDNLYWEIRSKINELAEILAQQKERGDYWQACFEKLLEDSGFQEEVLDSTPGGINIELNDALPF